MRTLTKSAVALALLFTVASCGSDSKSTSSTSADSVVSADSTVTGDSTVAGDSTIVVDSTMTADTAAAGDMGALQAQVLELETTFAATNGISLDAGCLANATAKLSDADAQLIIDAGPTGTPVLSADGQALQAEVTGCLTATATTTG